MGLLYTKFYLDFDSSEWRQTSNDPVEFQTIADDVTLDIEDASHTPHRLTFRNGGKIRVLRVTGRFRITWDDNDVTA